MKMGAILWLALTVSLSAYLAGAAENLIHNGNFETASSAQPPPGWAMWGARRYKVPANYTRDTTNPHGGAACFRIHHPANTAGYVVTDPKHAVRTRQGMAYTVRVWARTDVPGPTSLSTGCTSHFLASSAFSSRGSSFWP